MQVEDGVFQFKVPMPTNPNIPDGGLRYTLVYLVSVPGGWVVIDAGLNTDLGFEAFKESLHEAGIQPSDVKLIVITHGHPDHAGLANRFKSLTGAKLAMHRLDSGDGANPMARRDPEKTHKSMLRYGVPESELREGFVNHPQRNTSNTQDTVWRPPNPEVDFMLEGNEELLPGSDLWTIWTPGHSPGHICIHDRKRKLLFSGDHILPVITPHVSLFPGDEGNPLGEFISRQKDLRNLDVVAIHPAHEYSMPNPKERIDQLLEHHRERLDEIAATLSDGPKTAWQVASAIHWNVAPWPELSPWTRRMAMLETIAHLQYLAIEGEIAKQETDSTVSFAQP